MTPTREHDAGDLSEWDYQVLVARDRSRLAEVEAELAALGPELPADAEPDHPTGHRPHPTERQPHRPGAGSPTRARRRYGTWSRVGIVVACLFIVAGAVILVDHAMSPAAPGQAPSGSVTVSKAQQIEDQLAAAAVLTDDGEGQQALELYNKVLTEDPDDPDRARRGWLAGVERRRGRKIRGGRAGRAPVGGEGGARRAQLLRRSPLPGV